MVLREDGEYEMVVVYASRCRDRAARGFLNGTTVRLEPPEFGNLDPDHSVQDPHHARGQLLCLKCVATFLWAGPELDTISSPIHEERLEGCV